MSVVSRCFESVQLIGAAEMHLAGEHRAIAEKPQVMREGRNVGCELRRIVVDARARRQQPGHERGARRRAERAAAIGAVEHDAVARQRLDVRRAYEGVAVDRQERRRHLVGHDDENVGRFGGHWAGILVRPSVSRLARARLLFLKTPSVSPNRLDRQDASGKLTLRRECRYVFRPTKSNKPLIFISYAHADEPESRAARKSSG